MNRIEKNPFEQAGSWAEDRELRRERLQRRSWLIIWLLATVAVIEGLALIALMPLKKVVPYTILIDRQTGYVTTLDPAKPAALGADAALTRSLLVQYVAAREGFSYATVRSDYKKVMSWSDGTARAAYARDMTATSPESPFSRFGRAAVVEVVPKSVSELANGSALVRFDLVQRDGEGRSFAPTPYAAVVSYRFADRAMSVEERFLNPLGFAVTRYRRDPEAAPTVVTVAPVASAVSLPARIGGPQ